MMMGVEQIEEFLRNFLRFFDFDVVIFDFLLFFGGWSN